MTSLKLEAQEPLEQEAWVVTLRKLQVLAIVSQARRNAWGQNPSSWIEWLCADKRSFTSKAIQFELGKDYYAKFGLPSEQCKETCFRMCTQYAFRAEALLYLPHKKYSTAASCTEGLSTCVLLGDCIAQCFLVSLSTKFWDFWDKWGQAFWNGIPSRMGFMLNC